MRSMLNVAATILLLFATSARVEAASVAGQRVHPRPGFVENLGQFDARARFVLDHAGVTTFVCDDGLRFVLHDGAAVFLCFGGKTRASAAASQAIGLGMQCGRMNYFLGNDPNRFVSGARRFDGVRLVSVQPGVDIVLHALDDGIEYDLEVADSTLVSGLSLQWQGAKSLVRSVEDELRIQSAAGTLIQTAPRIFEVDESGERHAIAREFDLDDTGSMHFRIREDSNLRVVVDPAVKFCTMFGGSLGGDYPYALLPQDDGTLLITAQAYSSDFPTTPGAFDPSYNGFGDCSIQRISADGSSVLFGTLVGGVNNDGNLGLVRRANGEVICVGATQSPDFPTTSGCYDPTYNGNTDACVFELSADGSALIFSTFLGGSNSDGARGVGLGPGNLIYVAGNSNSSNWTFPPTAFQPTPISSYDRGFLATLSADGNSLIGGTFLEAQFFPTQLRSLGVTPDGFPVLTGATGLGFPVTQDAFDPTWGGSNDVFISILNPDGSALLHSTLYGEGDSDVAQSIAVAPNGDMIIAGDGQAPVTPGAFATQYKGFFDGFVARFAPDLTAVRYCGAFSSGGLDHCWGVAVDAAGCAYAVGEVGTNGSGFPITQDSFQPNKIAFAVDPAIMKINPEGTKVLFASFYGGPGDDAAYDVACGKSGDVFISGITFGSSFPTTPGAFDTTPVGPPGYNGFIARFDLCGGKFVSGGGGCPAGSAPTLAGVGCPSPGDAVSLEIGGAPSLAPALLLFGQGSAVLGVSPSCAITIGPLILPLVTPFMTPASGSLTLTGVLPPSLSVPFTMRAQMATLDPGAPFGIAVSNALSMTVDV